MDQADHELLSWWFELSETRKAAAENDGTLPSSWRCTFHRVSYDETVAAAAALGIPWTKERERLWRGVLHVQKRDLKKGCYMCSQPFEEFLEWRRDPSGDASSS